MKEILDCQVAMHMENVMNSCVAVVYDIYWSSLMLVTLLQQRDMVMICRCLSALCSYAVFKNN